MTPFSEKKSKLVLWAEFLTETRHWLSSTTGTIGFGISCAFLPNSVSKWPVFFLFVFCVCFIYGGWGLYKSQHTSKRKINNLNDKITELEDFNLNLTSENTQIANDLNAAQEGYSETLINLQNVFYNLFSQYLCNKILSRVNDFNADKRVSVYFLYENNFFIAGRYSLNHTYNSINRYRFPINEGCIGKAWESYDGECYSGTLPDFGSDSYLNTAKHQYNIPAETIKLLRMHSICYFAKTIENDQNRRIGVIVFESTKTNSFNIDDIKRILANENRDLCHYINEYIRLHNILLPYQSLKGGQDG